MVHNCWLYTYSKLVFLSFSLSMCVYHFLRHPPRICNPMYIVYVYKMEYIYIYMYIVRVNVFKKSYFFFLFN